MMEISLESVYEFVGKKDWWLRLSPCGRLVYIDMARNQFKKDGRYLFDFYDFIERTNFSIKDFVTGWTELHYAWVISGQPPYELGYKWALYYTPSLREFPPHCEYFTEPATAPRRPLSIEIRDTVHELDSFSCVYCGAPSEHVDHVVPVSRGGSDSLHNLVASCAKCNLTKSDKTLYELGWKFRPGTRPYVEGWRI